jgi:hypothetical protein
MKQYEHIEIESLNKQGTYFKVSAKDSGSWLCNVNFSKHLDSIAMECVDEDISKSQVIEILDLMSEIESGKAL